MKLIQIFLVASLFLTFNIANSMAQTTASKNNEVENSIEWLSFEVLEGKMKEKPKRVIVDIYTDWCKWCKVMDKKVYANPNLIKYVNEHFYAVKFNAEYKGDILFGDRTFRFREDVGMHELASEIMLGSRSFPTTVIMEANFMNVSPFGGYIELKDFEKLIRFFNEALDNGQSWEQWEKSFNREW